MTDTLSKILDPDDSSAGGGSASALAGAMAGALISMAAALSEPEADKSAAARVLDGASRARTLSRMLRAGADEDTLAFRAIRDSYRLPKTTEEEKAARSIAIGKAWAEATGVPLENASRCLAILEIGAELESLISPKVHSDYSSGLYLAQAGLLGCLDNVAINLPSLKDSLAAAEIASRAAAIRARADELAEWIAPLRRTKPEGNSR